MGRILKGGDYTEDSDQVRPEAGRALSATDGRFTLKLCPDHVCRLQGGPPRGGISF
jgi:hypothetical protein